MLPISNRWCRSALLGAMLILAAAACSKTEGQGGPSASGSGPASASPAAVRPDTPSPTHGSHAAADGGVVLMDAHDHSGGKRMDSQPVAGSGGGAAPHADAAPHGGVVQTTTGGHVELQARRDGAFKVWLLTDGLGPRPAAGATVKIKVAAKGYADVTAVAAGDHFEGQGAPIVGEHVTALVTATVAGKTETARFELHLEGPDAHGGADDGHAGHGGHNDDDDGHAGHGDGH